jgi:hypothetical protein
MNRHVIIKIESFEGQDTYLRCGNDDQDFLFAVVTIDDAGDAEIVDSGYRSYEEAVAGWPDTAPRRDTSQKR